MKYTKQKREMWKKLKTVKPVFTDRREIPLVKTIWHKEDEQVITAFFKRLKI